MTKCVVLFSLLLMNFFNSCYLVSGEQTSVDQLPTINKSFYTDKASTCIDEWDPVPWPRYQFPRFKLGQVSGVTFDPDGNILIFHRSDRVWDEKTFDDQNVYTGRNLGPIKEPTILVFSPRGDLMEELGRNLFYMPHGITVDGDFNIWVTDVALHQVLRISARNKTITLQLGEAFVPGRDLNHFCKPTSVAVVSNGDFFVADGYCNSRIIKYNAQGKVILQWGRTTNSLIHPPGHYDLYIPHALTLAEDRGLLCTADRENGRVVCYQIGTGEYVTELTLTGVGDRIFSVAYSSIEGGRFFLVNGPSLDVYRKIPVQGIVLNTSGNIVGKFGSNLSNPHDLAVSSDGNSVYVAEIQPFKIWKFVRRNPKIASKETKEESASADSYSSDVDNVEGLTGAILVTISCFVFAIGLIMAVLIYSKSRRTGSSDTRRLLSNVDY